MVSERRWLWIIFVLYFLLGIGYSLLMPIWEAPDEPAHYHLAWRLARKGEYASLEQNYEANQPRTFYVLGSYVIRALDLLDPGYSEYFFPPEFKYNFRVRERRFDWHDGNFRFLWGVYVLRWLNLLFGALALWLNWKTFRIIAPDKPTLQLSALALAALTPQYLHIMSSVNNDALGVLAGALLFYLAVWVAQSPQGRNRLPYQNEAADGGLSPRSRLGTFSQGLQSLAIDIVIILIAITLPFVTKLTALPVSVALLGIVAWKWFFGFRLKRWLGVSILALVCGAGILPVLFPEMIQTAWGEISWRLFSLRKKGVDFEYLKTITSQVVWTYWGKVGWLAVGLSWWVVDLLTIFGLVGTAIKIRNHIKSKTEHPQFKLWISTSLIALVTVLAVARNGLTTGATQGRLLFPAIGALSLLMVGGWHDVVPEKAQQKLPMAVTVLMVSLNIGLWVFGVIPVYYQPFLD